MSGENEGEDGLTEDESVSVISVSIIADRSSALQQ